MDPRVRVVGRVDDVRPVDEPGDAPPGCLTDFDVTVPYDYLWVMGDHRSASKDSRCQDGTDAFVPVDNVVGRAVAVFLPFGSAANGDLSLVSILAAAALFFLKLLFFYFVVAIIENSMARVRFIKASSITWAALAAAVLSFVFYLANV